MVKKRNLILLTITYWLTAVMFTGVAMITAGDCGISRSRADYEACARVGDKRRNYAFGLAVLGYPIVMALYIRRRREP